MTYRPDHERYHQHGRSTDMDPRHRHNDAEDGPRGECCRPDDLAEFDRGVQLAQRGRGPVTVTLCRPDDYPPYPPMAQPSPRTHAHIADPDKYRALRARILGMVEPA